MLAALSKFSNNSIDTVSIDSCDNKDEKEEHCSCVDKIKSTYLQVIVKIRKDEEGTMFKVEDLKNLHYFDCLFSDRWMKSNGQHDNHPAIITIFTNQSIIPQFGCQELTRLLYFVMNEKNDGFENVSLDNNDIDRLLYCQDFFNPCTNKICKNTILEYLKERRPVLSLTDIETWLTTDSMHAILRESLINLRDNFKQQLLSITMDMTTENNNFVGMNLEPDSDTAALLFVQMLKNITIVCDENEREIACNNFSEREWNKLIKLFNFNDYWHYWTKSISNIIDNLQYFDIDNGEILTIDTGLLNCIWYLLESILINFDKIINTEMNRKNANIPSNLSRLSLMKSLFNLVVFSESTFTQEEFETLSSINVLNAIISDIEQFTTIVLKCHGIYISNCLRNKAININGIGWFKFLKSMLLQCSHTFIVQYAHLWFPILHRKEHQNDINSITWVMENIVSKFGTQNAFNFALYLIDFAMHEEDHKKYSFPQCYCHFIKKVGIGWNVLPFEDNESNIQLQPDSQNQ